MKVGDLVKYHRAGKPPKIGVVSEVGVRVVVMNIGVSYYHVAFADNVLKLREDHLEVISASR